MFIATKNAGTQQWPAESVLDAAEIWSFGMGNTGSSTAAPIIPGATIFSTNKTDIVARLFKMYKELTTK